MTVIPKHLLEDRDERKKLREKAPEDEELRKALEAWDAENPEEALRDLNNDWGD